MPEGLLRVPEQSTILRFRHLLEPHGLAAQSFAAVNATLGAKGLMLETGSVVVTTLITAPNSTKNPTGTRGPELHQIQKGNHVYFGMKTHVAVDAGSGRVHHQVCTAANVHDLRVAYRLLQGKERRAFADSGYRGVVQWSRRQHIRWAMAMTPPDQRKAQDPSRPIDALKHRAERIKASIRAKADHLFPVLKRQFGDTKARKRPRKGKV